MTVKIKNAAFGTLAGNISAVQTTISLTSGQGARFPALSPGDWFWGTLANAANVQEVVKVTATAADTFTVLRGQDGTTASAYLAGDRFELRTPAALWNDFVDKQTLNTHMTALFAGIISLWSGSIASIPAGWHLCDGTAGTPNLRDKFIVGAGSAYAVGATGGAATYSLTVNQLPAHGHGVTDPSHAHAVYDPTHTHTVNDPSHTHYVNDPGHNHAISQSGHGHGLSDPGHAHSISDPGHQHVVPYGESISYPWGTYAGSQLGSHGGLDSDNNWPYTSPTGTGIGIFGSGTGMGVQAQIANVNNVGSATGVYLSYSGTGTYLTARATGIGIYAATTGIAIQNTGSGAAIENRPPYYALAYIMYTGTDIT
jgi:microcystin-dependent protein